MTEQVQDQQQDAGNDQSNDGGSNNQWQTGNQATSSTDAQGTSNQTAQDQGAQNQGTENNQQSAGGTGQFQNPSRQGRQAGPPSYQYNPETAVRAGLIHLADAWKEAGASYQAISAYTEILARYPGTGAASAAEEGLLDLANRMEREGRYYGALGIFHKLEALV